MSPLQIVGLGLAAITIYSAIKDINPLDLLKNTLQGKAPPQSGSWSPAESQSVVTQAVAMAGQGTITNAVAGTFSGKSIWPTKSHRISQAYGVKNDRYEKGYHTGVDIDGACGDPIWAAQAGRVIAAGYNGPYGLQVKVSIDKNTEVWYNHFMSIGAAVRPGYQVAAGTHLGRMGSTGNSSGCHLHFEVRQNGTDVNPSPWLSGSSVSV